MISNFVCNLIWKVFRNGGVLSHIGPIWSQEMPEIKELRDLGHYLKKLMLYCFQTQQKLNGQSMFLLFGQMNSIWFLLVA